MTKYIKCKYCNHKHPKGYMLKCHDKTYMCDVECIDCSVN